MRAMVDISGQRFGRLVALEPAGALWKCVCDCGNEHMARASDLTRGHTQSCGCRRRELSRGRIGKLSRTTHGESHLRLYRIWANMKDRCNNPQADNYGHYGGRGVRVCQEWSDSFTSFREWALNNGYRNSLTIDRINNDGPYAPWNCRWTTRVIQANNKRTNCVLELDGECRTMSEWGLLLDISPDVIRKRLSLGWPVKRALTEPVHKKKKAAPAAAETTSYNDENEPNSLYNGFRDKSSEGDDKT